MKPNDAPPPPMPPASWNPQERGVWLVSHRAPSNMRLVTINEITMLEGHCQRGLAVQLEIDTAAKELDSFGYWQDYPGIAPACKAAAFDARRYERATTAAIERLDKSLPFLNGLAEQIAKLGMPKETFPMIGDLISETYELGEALKFLKAQAAATPPKPEKA